MESNRKRQQAIESKENQWNDNEHQWNNTKINKESKQQQTYDKSNTEKHFNEKSTK